jgi:hypothetical protein
MTLNELFGAAAVVASLDDLVVYTRSESAIRQWSMEIRLKYAPVAVEWLVKGEPTSVAVS